MEFEFDPEKDQANQEKHRIDFARAQQLWHGPSVDFAARQEYENRFARIGLLKGKLYTCIYTLREDRIRIISCRRSRKNEEVLYAKGIKDT